MRQGTERNIYLFGIVLLVVGVGLVLWGAFVGVRAWSSTTWPTTEGTVISARIERRVDINSRSTESTKFNYEPLVQYTYAVDGDTFTADRISMHLDSQYGQRADAEAVLDRYRPNSPVTVYYNPDDAGEAVLEPGLAWTTFIPLGLGLFGLVFGLLFARRPDLF